MRAHGVIWLLLALVGSGCSTTRVVLLDTRDGPPSIHTPFVEDGGGPAELDEEEFEEALVELVRDVQPFANPLREARALFGVPERGGVYWYEGRGPRLIPQEKAATAHVCWSRTGTKS